MDMEGEAGSGQVAKAWLSLRLPFCHADFFLPRRHLQSYVLTAHCHFYICPDHDRREWCARYNSHVWVMWCMALGKDAGSCPYVWNTNLALYSWSWTCWYVCGKVSPAWIISAEMWNFWNRRHVTYIFPISSQSSSVIFSPYINTQDGSC